VHRVGEDEVEHAVEDVPNGPPVDAGGFHGDVSDSEAGEPVRQLQQAGGRGGEGLDRLLESLLRHDPGAGDDAVLVDVQAGAPWMQDLHGSLLVWSCAGMEPTWSNSSVRAPGLAPVATVRGARGALGPTDIRACGTKSEPTSMPAYQEAYTRFVRRESSQSVAN